MNLDWLDVAAADEVPDGDIVAVNPACTAGRELALVRLGAEIFAIDARAGSWRGSSKEPS